VTDWKLAHYNHAHVSSTDLDFDHPRPSDIKRQSCRRVPADIANLHQRIIRVIDIMVNKIDKLIWEKPGGREKGLKSTPLLFRTLRMVVTHLSQGSNSPRPSSHGSWSVTIYQCGRAISRVTFLSKQCDDVKKN